MLVSYELIPWPDGGIPGLEPVSFAVGEYIPPILMVNCLVKLMPMPAVK